MILSLILNSNCSLLTYKKAIDFCIFTLLLPCYNLLLVPGIFVCIFKIFYIDNNVICEQGQFYFFLPSLHTFYVLLFYFYFFPFILISWRLITLQYCSGFCHTLTWISHGFTCIPHPDPPSHLPPHSGSSQRTSPEHLSHASNLDWWSVSHLIIYMFQWRSLKSSHPHLLPQSPKVCSLHLCLFLCLAHRVIVTIFLNSIYMH